MINRFNLVSINLFCTFNLLFYVSDKKEGFVFFFWILIIASSSTELFQAKIQLFFPWPMLLSCFSVKIYNITVIIIISDVNLCYFLQLSVFLCLWKTRKRGGEKKSLLYWKTNYTLEINMILHFYAEWKKLIKKKKGCR